MFSLLKCFLLLYMYIHTDGIFWNCIYCLKVQWANIGNKITKRQNSVSHFYWKREMSIYLFKHSRTDSKINILKNLKHESVDRILLQRIQLMIELYLALFGCSQFLCALEKPLLKLIKKKEKQIDSSSFFSRTYQLFTLLCTVMYPNFFLQG